MGVTFEEIERQFIDAGFGEQFESACSILLPRLERRSDQRSYVNCVVLTGDVYENKIMFAGLLYDMAKKVIGCRDLRVIRSVPYNNADFKDSTQEWMEAGEDTTLKSCIFCIFYQIQHSSDSVTSLVLSSLDIHLRRVHSKKSHLYFFAKTNE